MSIDLTAVRCRKAVPLPVVFGRVQRPSTGGAAYRIDRMGDRWAFDMMTAAMRVEPDGRLLQALFDDADRLGGLFRVRQPDFDIGAPGFACAVAADTAAGRMVPIAGVTPRYPIRRGQWLSIIVDGQRYLDRAMDQVRVASDGTATVRIKNLVRVPLSEGDVVELAEPKIEGTVEMHSAPEWDEGRMTQFAFTVSEDA